MAVITAMLLVALAASTAAFLLWRQQLWLQQVEGFAARAQANAYASASIEWARRSAGSTFLPAGVGGATTQDPQGLFNLNNLVRNGKPSDPDITAMKRLLALAGLPETLANSLLDAIDADSEATFPGGAEDLDYLAMDPPQRATNRALLEVSSLARIKGFAPDAIARLRPYVVALPEPTALNVNSAPAQVLQAAIPGLSDSAAQAIVAKRARKPFETVNAFRAELPSEVRLPPGIAFGVASTYLLVSTAARTGRAEARQQALVGMSGARREGIVWRREGE